MLKEEAACHGGLEETQNLELVLLTRNACQSLLWVCFLICKMNVLA